MLKKSFIPFVLVVVLVGLTLTSYDGHAMSEYEKITQQMKQVQQEAAKHARQQKEAERQLAQLQRERNQALQDLNQIKAELEANSLAMLELQSQIIDAENAAIDAHEQFVAVSKRVEERNELIEERLRMMYKKGEVKYIDVLMDSTSFSDFLDRLHYLNLVVSQDNTILEQQKVEKELKEQKKLEREEALAMLQDLYHEKELKELELTELRKQQEVQIASIQSQEEHYHHISEEAEKLVMQLAAKEAELNEKRRKLAFSAGKLAYPLPREYPITSNFGTRVDPITGKKGAHHAGIDFGAPGGTSILAAADGYVLAAQWVNGYGNYVIIDHGSGIWTLYAHMSKIVAKKGDEVKVGDKIGEVGTTGRSTGNHLHFEVRKNQKAVDPNPYLK